jgi:hypothetical protein
MFYRDQEFLGNGHAIDATDDGEYYMLTSYKPGENSEFRVSYDGGEAGLMGSIMNTFMDGGHFAYYRDVNGAQHVIYDGNDLGVGDNIGLSGGHYVFARKIGAEWHTIYDGKDIGIGSYPKILGDDMVVQRNVDGFAHLFLNSSDLGICGAQAQGAQTDDCWPDLSR